MEVISMKRASAGDFVDETRASTQLAVAIRKDHERKPQTRRKQLPDEEWERHKTAILELYKTNELSVLKEEMLKRGFNAS
jgi:hypothetical protein